MSHVNVSVTVMPTINSVRTTEKKMICWVSSVMLVTVLIPASILFIMCSAHSLTWCEMIFKPCEDSGDTAVIVFDLHIYVYVVIDLYTHSIHDSRSPSSGGVDNCGQVV